jgi:hypothetical protein
MIRVRERLPIAGLLTKAFRTASGLLWLPRTGIVDPSRNVLALLRRPDGTALLYAAANIVTDAGDIYFAERAAGESPTNAFTAWEMYSAGTPGKAADRSDFTPIGSSVQAQDGGYPQTDDADSDNTGADVNVRTSRVSYTASSWSGTATHGGITNTTPGASEPMLAGWEWDDPIVKTLSDTLKAFHNVAVVGV